MDTILWSAARSLVVCLLSLLPAMLIWRTIRQSDSPRFRSLWMLMAVLPFFVPELLIGFTYRILAARLVHSAAATEVLYGLLLFCRSVSLAVLALMLLPESGVSRQAIHSWKLLRPHSSAAVSIRWRWQMTRLLLQVQGPWRPLLVAGCLSYLVSFQEFETAALMQIDRHPIAWTVWLFDAHAANQPLGTSLRWALAPLLLELCVVIPPLLLWVPRSLSAAERSAPSGISRSSGSGSLNPPVGARLISQRVRVFLAVFWTLLGVWLFVVWPVLSNAGPLLAGLSLMTRPSALLMQSFRQILTSLGFAAGAAIVALWLSSAMLGRRGAGPAGAASTFIRRLLRCLLLPGLMGALVTALVLLTLFQSPVLSVVYDTWLPLLAGLTLSVLPRALLFSALVLQMFDPAAWHTTRLLDESRSYASQRAAAGIRWRMQTFAWTAAATVLCHWCFWDVTTASILRPVQLEPVVTRLYNEMHYGRTEAVLVIAVLSAIAPWLLGATAMAAAWLLRRLLHRGERS